MQPTGFSLSPAPAECFSAFSFVQITDCHIGGVDESQHPSIDARDMGAPSFADDLETISRHNPDFIIDTGDITESGKVHQYDNYRRIVKSARIPIYTLIGNHDIMEHDRTFEERMGAAYCAFDHKGCHFVLLNSVYDVEKQLRWLTKDLQKQERGKKIFVFQHNPPDEKLSALLVRHSVTAVFSGHMHRAKTIFTGGVWHINSPTLRFGGLDGSPRGFRIIRVRADKFELTDIYGGCRSFCAVVAPLDGSRVSGQPLEIQLTAYDSATEKLHVKYRLDEGLWKQMEKVTFMRWAGKETGLNGTHRIETKITYSDGKIIATKPVSFFVENGAEPCPRPGLNWPMLQQNPGRTGVSAETLAPPLRLAWSRFIGGRILLSSPVVWNGTVYIGISDEEMAGHAGICALDGVSGETRWFYPVSASIKHTVNVADGVLIAVDVNGTIYALNAESGKIIWQARGRNVDRWFYSSTLIMGGVLYAGLGDSFSAMRLDNGKEIWKDGGLGESTPGLGSPAFDGHAIVVSFYSKKGLFALNPADGSILWNSKSCIFGYTSPVCLNGKVYMADYYEGDLVALDSRNGNEVWRLNCGGRLLTSPAVDEQTAVAVTDGGRVLGINSLSGERKWQFNMGPPIFFFSPYRRNAGAGLASPIISGGTAFIGGNDGRLMAVETNSGKICWQFNLGAPITSAPAISGNALYAAAFDGSVHAFVGQKKD